MNIGVLLNFNEGNVENEFAKTAELGFKFCQLCCWSLESFTDAVAERVVNASQKYNVKITSLWCGWKGPAVWDFYDGPLTLGLTPVEYRFERMNNLFLGSDFAKKIGVDNLVTHAGFIPENPSTEGYSSLIAALRKVAAYCKGNGQYFLFETGQETPVTLLRAIEDIGTGNLGINLDPANLILYGKANPVDALDVFGRYVRDVHAKDGCYPTEGKNLGEETPIGEGKVNFPALVKKLKEIGYDGVLNIEREISGEQQIKDIINAKKYLEELL